MGYPKNSNGPLVSKIITSNYTLDKENDKSLQVVCTTSDITITLPEADTCPNDNLIRDFYIKKSDSTSYKVNIVCSGSNVFSGGNSKIVLRSKTDIVRVGCKYIGDGVQGWINIQAVRVREQISRSSSWAASNFDTSYAAIPFDTTNVEDNDTVLSHSTVTNPTRINIKVSGSYSFSYWGSIDSTTGSTYFVEMVLQKNGTTELSNSYCSAGNYQGEDQGLAIGNTAIDLVSGDYVELLIRHDGNLTGFLENPNLTANIII